MKGPRVRFWKVGLLAIIASFAVAAAAFAAVNAEAPTIRADPEVVALGRRLMLEGTAAGARAGDDVEIQFKECHNTFFRIYATPKTDAGGLYRYEVPGIEANTYFRARANGATSAPVYVRRRVSVALDVKGRGRFIARVFSPYVNLHGRQVRLERFSAGGWTLIRTARLNKLSARQYEARFLVRTRGLQLRAALAEATVRPCYVAGVSPIVRS